MDRDAFVHDVLHGGDRRFGATLLRALLTPTDWLHRAILEAYLLPFRTGLRQRYRLSVPVIAIGNLASGGTGKTPMAALVAGRLKREGHRVVLLSRGHGGSGESSHAPRIVSDGEQILLGPDEAGDEPVLLAHLLPGVPVVVGRDRRRSGRLAVEQFAPEVIVLDDALQYWQLHRDLDIVLLDACRPFDNGYVIPRGLLREPPSHLARAGVVVLTRADRAKSTALEANLSRVRRLAPQAEALTATHASLAWVSLADGTIYPLSTLAGTPVFAFSGIADGNAFVETVQNLGANVISHRDFGDHHAYTPEEIAQVQDDARSAGATIAVTTEKDGVKLGPLWNTASGPTLYTLRIGMQVHDEEALWRRIQTALSARV